MTTYVLAVRLHHLNDMKYNFDNFKAQVHTSAVSNLRYGWWAYALGERTTTRFKENSKIISIDGNLASGKGALAQKLADKLGKTISGYIYPGSIYIFTATII